MNTDWKPVTPPQLTPEFPRTVPFARRPEYGTDWTLTHSEAGHVRLGTRKPSSRTTTVEGNPDYDLIFCFHPDDLMEMATRLLEAHLVNEVGIKAATTAIEAIDDMNQRLSIPPTTARNYRTRVASMIARLRELA